MKNYKQFKKEILKDKGIKKAYNDLGPEFAVIEAIMQKRLAKGLTQAQLARKVGTKQSAIARLESGTYNPTILFLRKVANALDARLEILVS